MAGGPIERQEFDGYVRRHESDADAHARLARQIKADVFGVVDDHGARIGALERWQQRIIGGMLFAAFLVGGSGAVTVIELLRK